MDKTISTPKVIEQELVDAPALDSNGIEKPLSGSEEGERHHSHELERVLEWGGPNSRYGKINVILGKGAYKIVWKAIDKDEGIELAWNCCQSTRTEFNEFSEEVEILKKVRHSNIITFHDSWYSNGEFVFITELMTSGTLREYIKKLKTPSIKIIKRWSRQILKGLTYLHAHSPPIIHRDIKCDNIFINGSHGEVKIGDMGTAKMRFGKKYTVIGTPEFMAPEMYEEKGYNEKVDIYAFGMCLLEMATGEYPYSECKNAAQIYKKVSQGIKPDCLNKVQDKDILTIINNCLAPEAERWSSKKLSEHPFFAEDPEVLLIQTNESKTKLKLQVLFKGQDRHSVKFEYNRDTDTAEDVVREMIEEKILPAKYQGLICSEIHRILRDLSKLHQFNLNLGNLSSPMDILRHQDGSFHKRVNSENETMSGIIQSSRSRSRPRQGPCSDETMESISRSMATISMESPSIVTPINSHSIRRSSASTFDLRGSESFDSETSMKEYGNDVLIDDFILDVASLVNRPAEKAQEWLIKLKSEDILTVGDLRELLDEDWSRLNLTVFATRAIKNVLMGRVKVNPLDLMSPRVSGKISDSHSNSARE